MELAETSSLRIFVAVIKCGSFTAGAKQEGITRSAAGKAVVRLEELLGVRLIQRTTRSIGLTTDGHHFFQKAESILTALEQAQNEIMRREQIPVGTLKLTMPEAFGRQKILPVISEFMRQWPDIKVEISFNDKVENIIDRGFDLAIRMGPVNKNPSDMIVRVITNLTARLAASPVYLDKKGRLSTPSELNVHKQLVAGSSSGIHQWILAGPGNERIDVQMNPTMILDSAGGLVDAALEGSGIVCLPEFLLESHAKNKQLEYVLPEYKTDNIPVSLLYPSKKHLPPRVRCFIDLLTEMISK